eukprot:TRINITY_DN1429_c0_g1_i4.p1 TRINITY_DN1429_c0_g1~~TRINITY_DN1429_c0_g1_i4.p1  ORF type:complete len:770 (+),score=162.17 TRINITY_DN1429_c0_g1_i4:107-2416(+)
MPAVTQDASCMFAIALLATLGSQVAQGFQRTRQVSTSEAALHLKGSSGDGGGRVEAPLPTASSFGIDPVKTTIMQTDETRNHIASTSANAPQKAAVHVTIDIAELAEPDNATIIEDGIDSMLALMSKSVFNASATVENLTRLIVQDAKSNLTTMVWKSTNSTCGVLDGVVQKTAEFNCSFGEIYKRYENATSVNTTPVMAECVVQPEDSPRHFCTMKVDSGVANSSMRKLCASGMQQLVTPVYESIRRDAQAFELATNSTIEAIMDNFTNFTRGGQNSSAFHALANKTKGAQNLSKAIHDAVKDFNRSLNSQLHEVISGFQSNLSSQIEKALHATEGPLDNYSNNTVVFAKAIYAAANLSRWLIPDMKVNLAFANLSLDRAMALTDNLSNVAQAAKQKIGEANKALREKDQARDSAAYFVNMSLKKSAEASKAMTLMADPDSNVSAEYVANLTSSAKAAAAKAGELSDRQVQAEIKHKAATIDSEALARKEYFIAKEIAIELQNVLTRVSQALDDDATEVNRTLGFFNSSVRRSMEDALVDQQAGLYPVRINISITGDNFTKAMRVLEKAGIDIQGIQASLLQISAASNQTEAKPGNVTVNVTIDNGDEALLRNISITVSQRLGRIFSSKAAFNVSHSVHRTGNSSELIIQAIVPDVTSKTVKRIVNATQIAIQDAMGQASEEETADVGIGVVGSNRSKTLEGVLDNMTEVVSDAEIAGEIVFGKPEAPAAVKKTKFPYSHLALSGILVLVILGLLVICCNRFSRSQEA